ncbi:ABC transporter transmembrane domain-containing protein [Candidatus Thioglobus sp. NP1]|uniref:ABC transporter transmembrane domain-containing protein n=1 Tax=Candidatus Thioglobus sp. NP1 TaxID=2508687 RepID=UPI000DEDCE76|nr:ABC transporter transmembrane domain-containing protein [Candidatus Thioglobus sp. NP1]AXE61627.1 ABC transporter ATP-binding protein [Candidatus Thioglobus sp. NP1]
MSLANRVITDSKKNVQKQDLRLLLRLAPFIKPYKKVALIAGIALILSSIAFLLLGQGIKLFIDEGLYTLNSRAMLTIFFVLLIMVVSTFVRFYFVSWIGERVSNDVRLAVFKHLLTLHPHYFELNRSGEINARLTTDTTLLQSIFGFSISMALSSALLFLGGLTMMLITNLKLALIVLISVPIILLPMIIYGRRLRSLSRQSQDRVADIGTYAGEIVQNIKVVQSFTREPEESKAFSIEVEKAFSAAKQRIMQSSLLIAAAMILVFTGLGAMIWTGGRDVTSGIITAGELAAFVFYAIMVARSVAVISEIYGQLQRAAGATERLLELLTEESQIIAPANPKKLSKGPLSLSFQNVSFSYPSRVEQYAIEDISFDINAGETVAIVGLSGAGKTTIFELFQRFYDPTNGSIKIDDINIVDLDPNELRSSIGHVPQQPTLFSADVTHNIGYGKPLATENEINNAATKAYAIEFIDQLPDGFKSYLGEQGVRLSGGQRQRIAIARAMLKDPSILLLDEATSALDASSEQKVQAALKDLMQGRTTLIIAHRLATIMHADRILLIDQGKLIAQGDHKGLLDSSELYKQLCELQFNH